VLLKARKGSPRTEEERDASNDPKVTPERRTTSAPTATHLGNTLRTPNKL